MTNVLTKIVDERRGDIEALKQSLPLDSFIEELTPSTRSLFTALSETQTSFILEFKKASPSKGLIRDNFDLDEIIAAYQPHATAVSVLTEHRYFQGDFNYLSYVASQLTQPVINKDFFFDPYQVYLARHYNADAILLMLSVLNDDEYRSLAAIAESLSLDVLTEVSNPEEVERAIALEAKIIGINNRNLRDLSTDLATTEVLKPLIPSDRLVISESGIYTHQDVKRLSAISDGFLVGSSLMAESDLNRAVSNLVLGTVKICGITNTEDAMKAKQSGASYCGLIFAPKSKRCVSHQQAQDIVEAVPFHYVGVFVDQSIEEIVSLAQNLKLKAVQLHGNESKAYQQELELKLPTGCVIWEAVGVDKHIPEFDNPNAALHLLDCKVGNESGGTGQSFDWSLITKLTKTGPIGIAGGLSVSNIEQAAALNVSLLDVNSGVELAPGEKSAEKIEQLFEKLRCY